MTTTPPSKRPVRQRASTPEEVASTPSRAEVETAAADAGWITIDFLGEPVRLLPAMDWPKGTYQAVIHGGDFDALADVLHEDDQDLWLTSECTLREALEFLEKAVRASGQDMGESRASRRFAQRMARR